jgi:hypothetical protein
MKLEILPRIFSVFENEDSFEFIVVDRMSEDKTVAYIKSLPLFQKSPEKLKVIQTSSNERGKRLLEGCKIASGWIILLHHPRSFLEREGILSLMLMRETFFWGGYTHRFDWESPLLNFTSWYSNHVRADLRHIFYLDHCIFINHDLLLKIEFPDVPIFEDTILSERLNKICRPIRLPSISTTSSIRFRKNGILYQALLNQVMKLGFFLGVPLYKLNIFYEKSLELNSKYKKMPS